PARSFRCRRSTGWHLTACGDAPDRCARAGTAYPSEPLLASLARLGSSTRVSAGRAGLPGTHRPAAATRSVSRRRRREPLGARDRLDGPAVAVWIVEEDERSPRKVLNVADADAPRDQLGASCV